jgi:type IV pilus assembly protein PilV
MEVAHRMPSRSQAGVTLVEVLVTMVILAIGLLGLVALQARVQILQAEAYQRAQALMLLKDMAGRIANNRNNADDYLIDPDASIGAPIPADEELDCPGPGADRATTDISEWCTALAGASESLDGGGNVGAMVGGRGCVEDVGPGEYLVTVAWQGLAPISAPPESVACAAGLYDGDAGSPCTGDLCRRVVTTVVIIPPLD